MAKHAGTSYQESQYPSLFSAIGRRYGGSSASRTFRIPDLVSGNRYLRAAGGSLGVGTEQDDATAANGMTVDLVVCQRIGGVLMRNAAYVCMRCVLCLFGSLGYGIVMPTSLGAPGVPYIELCYSIV